MVDLRVVALLGVGGGADLLVGGGAVGGVVVPHRPVVRLPPLDSLGHGLHHLEELLGLQGSLAASDLLAQLEENHLTRDHL